jgi:phospholipase/lecithinase/hemolysin
VIPGIAAGATGLSMHYNARLAERLGEVAGLNNIELIRFDAFGSLQQVQANPQRFGLTDATNACLQPGVPPLFRCAQPDRHLFWDGIHPTRAGHAIIAVLAGKAIVTALANDD